MNFLHWTIILICLAVCAAAVFFWKTARVELRSNEAIIAIIAAITVVTYLIDGEVLDKYYDGIVMLLALGLLSSSMVKIMRYKIDERLVKKALEKLQGD